MFDRIRGAYGTGQLPRTLNMITGPSRTGDIEQRLRAQGAWAETPASSSSRIPSVDKTDRESLMKLFRHGAIRREKPGLIDRSGKLRDLSKIIDDITPEAISPQELRSSRRSMARACR